MELRLLSENRFLLRFQHETDRKRAVEGRSWIFDRNLIILSRIDAECNSMQVLLQQCPFHVHIHGLPVRLMTRDVGVTIGNQLGRVIEDNSRQSQQTWGAHLRIRVVLNVRRPLHRRMKIHSPNGDELMGWGGGVWGRFGNEDGVGDSGARREADIFAVGFSKGRGGLRTAEEGVGKLATTAIGQATVGIGANLVVGTRGEGELNVGRREANVGREFGEVGRTGGGPRNVSSGDDVGLDHAAWVRESRELGRLSGSLAAGPPPSFSNQGCPKLMSKAQPPNHHVEVRSLIVQNSSTSEPSLALTQASAGHPTQGLDDNEGWDKAENSAGEEVAVCAAVALDSSGHGKLPYDMPISNLSPSSTVGTDLNGGADELPSFQDYLGGKGETRVLGRRSLSGWRWRPAVTVNRAPRKVHRIIYIPLLGDLNIMLWRMSFP
ncbi:hypothetical protein Salat_1248100 [Sesamum alatum]|uniref:DUF4283 domain-containing protein n=1 Tax=Sesamum alatum TaxID=300844 RepID=A0AAE1YFS5_9LAMI|nr:hypothetical protein Salat_1248100 [Sesamum alatum]